MSSTDQRQNSTTPEQQSDTHSQYFPVTDPLPSPDNFYNEMYSASAYTRAGTTSPISTFSAKNPTAPLPADASPNVTRQLTGYMPATHTGALSSTAFPPLVRTTTTSLRQPVVILGSDTKSEGMPRPPKGRRMVVSIAATVLLVFILLTTVSIVIPVDSDSKGSFNLFHPIVRFVKSSDSNVGLIAQQVATATAVTQDGFDPGGAKVYAGIPTAPTTGSPNNLGSPDSPGSTLGRFFYGQCTYWADYRYHQLTGHWVAWLGNADEWVYGAQSDGWAVSSTPHAPSIMVLMPGTQGAGPYGHVAIVEGVNADGSVTTSNFNWLGAWGVETTVQFRPGPGVYFVSYPGA